jgi:hypothetical protein
MTTLYLPWGFFVLCSTVTGSDSDALGLAVLNQFFLGEVWVTLDVGE